MLSPLRHALIPLALALSAPAFAQTLSLPPSGENQKATVTQQIGPVTVSVDYSSPRVTLNGNDRRGKIFGKLVAYGLSDLGFNNCTKCPWRAGANENTIFTTSHEVKIQGRALAAGKYGVHMIPGPEEWTVIFSKETHAWGSFSYDPKEDALRVQVKPAKSEFHEWLAYEFTEREPAKATLALKWDELQVPITITVEHAPELWLAGVRNELRGFPGFLWQNQKQAADYALQNKVDLPDAQKWAEAAANQATGGDENFGTLMTLSRAQEANGHAELAKQTEAKALAHPTAKPTDLHLFGRQLLTAGKKDEALRIFKINAERHPNQWPVHVGLMRGYAAMGDNAKALEEAKLAVVQAPDPGNKKNLEKIIGDLQEGKKID